MPNLGAIGSNTIFCEISLVTGPQPPIFGAPEDNELMQFVALGSAHSSSLPLNCGVPQGSVLGPILYLHYVDPLGDIEASQHVFSLLR